MERLRRELYPGEPPYPMTHAEATVALTRLEQRFPPTYEAEARLRQFMQRYLTELRESDRSVQVHEEFERAACCIEVSPRPGVVDLDDYWGVLMGWQSRHPELRDRVQWAEPAARSRPISNPFHIQKRSNRW